MPYETLLFQVADGVATLTLNRPQSLNAFSAQMQRDLAVVIAQIAEDPAVRAVILTGAGRAFCAGGDIGEMAEAAQPVPLAGRNKLHRMLTTVLMPLVRLEKPVIAAVNGAAIGAGMNLALAADNAQRMAEHNAALMIENRSQRGIIQDLRDALTEANQELEILRGELQSARNSQPAIDWLGQEM